MTQWFPQEGPQLAAIEADWVDEVFYGGERGGGKSDFQLGYQEDGALRYREGWRGIMFRKSYPELEELQSRAMEVFPETGATFRTQPSKDYPFSNCWYWPSGASVKMRYIEREADYGRYHGHQYTGISFDEVTEYATPSGLLRMLSTLRSAAGVPCTVRLTGNPGGVGHSWVKSRYIDVGPPRTPHKDPDTGFTRMFIPSRTSDNAILLKNDPGYKNRIMAATYGNEALRKAWLEGDWNIVAGAFFNCWSSQLILRPCALPEWWTRFRSGDWGSARPFSFGWWAIAGDDFTHPDGQVIPKGSLVRYREYYGCEDPVKNPNTGLKIPAEEAAKHILHLERGEKVGYGVLDPAAFSSDGGPSIAERLYSGSGNKLLFRRADNARVASKGAMGGWDQVRARMLGEDGRPLIYCFSNCTDSIRTIPMLQHDENRVEDVNSDMEDHCFIAGTLVETIDGPKPIETLTDGLVLTVGNRYVPFRSGRLVKRMADVIRLSFDDGSVVICTADHKFLLDHDEWCYASDLLNRSVVCSQSSLARQSNNSDQFDTIGVEDTSRIKEFGYIEWSGNITMDQSHLDLISTTKTKTLPTTHQKISNVFRNLSIWAENMAQKVGNGGGNLSPSRKPPQPFGINRQQGSSGTKNSGIGLEEERLKDILNGALDAKRTTKGIQTQNTVTLTARHALCVGVENILDKHNVYCITVPETGCFALAGGLIVKNCADEWRYACMSRPYVRPAPTKPVQPKFLHETSLDELWEGTGKQASRKRI